MTKKTKGYMSVTHRSRYKTKSGWQDGLITQENITATDDESIALAMRDLTAPLREKIDRHLESFEAEAKEVAKLNGYESTLEPPVEKKPTGGARFAHVGQTAEPCSAFSFAYEIEEPARRCRRIFTELDKEGLSEGVQWKIETLFLEACRMVDGRRLLHISELEPAAVSGGRLLEQRGGTPPSVQREAVKAYHQLKQENPNKGETWLKETIAKTYGVHRSRVHSWIQKHN